MDILDTHDALMLIAIIAVVALAALTGMCINKVYIHHAHRRALSELKRRILEEAPAPLNLTRAPQTESSNH